MLNKTATARFKVLALYENSGHHVAYSEAARIWLNQLASDSNFKVDYMQQPKTNYRSTAETISVI